ncbi:hypothetical protein BHM03_00004421 [Ensete ventricosum]|nr:hypothetical protein BHM03_00004421 [Ensete ventricosum]
MQCSLISGYFHNFTEEQTMMLKVFPDDNLGSTAHDRKKEQKKGIHMTPTTMMPSISMLALPERENVFILRADTSRVGIGVPLMQDGPRVYTIAMMGYAEENESTVLELTYNYGVTEYIKGNAYAQVAISTEDVYRSAAVVDLVTNELGGKITRQPGPIPGINTKITSFLDPDGWKVASPLISVLNETS